MLGRFLIHKHAATLVGLGVRYWVDTLHMYLGRLHMDTGGWATHCCRRGGAADMLAGDGLHGMLSTGGWSTVRSAFPYTPADEVEMHMMANLRIDASDED